MITHLSPEQFIKEVQEWTGNQKSLIKVRMMTKGDFIYCKMAIPRTDEFIQTRIEKSKEIQLMNLYPVSTPAIWEDEMDELKQIKKRLEGLQDANTFSEPYDRSNSSFKKE